MSSSVLRRIAAGLVVAQFVVLVGTFLGARTPTLWVWQTVSFAAAVTVCLITSDRLCLCLSLIMLFTSQQATFVFANPTWGFAYGSDSINDFHTASLMSETSRFDLGQLGYSTRLSYSFYPMIHLFSVTLSSISGVPLISVAMYFVPFSCALLTCLSLFCLNSDLFGLKKRERALATLLFEMAFVYSWFQSQYVRETFAFPLVLLSLWLAMKIVQTRRPNTHVLMMLVSLAVVLSHLFSSYLLGVILAVIVLGLNVFRRNRRLNTPLLLVIVMLGAYTSFVIWTFFVTQATYTLQGLQAIFLREELPSIMRPHESWRTYLAMAYYATVAAITFVGGFALLRNKKKNWAVMTVLAFFVLAFGLSVLLRLSTSADPWSFTYYMSLRGTIWAFIGVSVLMVYGIKHLLGLEAIKWRNYIPIVLIVCLLALGKFSQYPLMISDPSIPLSLTSSRHEAALWLKDSAVHGTSLLVAPFEVDSEAFESSRNMAPYAYLKEYFLDEARGRTFEKFKGYVAFVGEFFSQYHGLSNVDIIYSNGNVEVGYVPDSA